MEERDKSLEQTSSAILSDTVELEALLEERRVVADPSRLAVIRHRAKVVAGRLRTLARREREQGDELKGADAEPIERSPGHGS